MPKQRRTLGPKAKNISSKGAIAIAKPEMTLTGFEHSKKTQNLLSKLKENEGIKAEFGDIINSSRRSHSKHSAGQHSFREDLANPPSEGKSTQRSARENAF